MQSLHQNVKWVNFFIATDQTSDTTGTGIDTAGYDDLLVIVSMGAIAGTGATLVITMQNSDAVGGTYADITGAAFASITSANDVALFAGRINLRTLANRFIRADLDFSGTVTAAPVAVMGILSRTGILPITNSPAVSFNVT